MVLRRRSFKYYKKRVLKVVNQPPSPCGEGMRVGSVYRRGRAEYYQEGICRVSFYGERLTGTQVCVPSLKNGGIFFIEGHENEK